MKFEKLFLVNFRHEYYNSKKFLGFRVSPTLHSQQLSKSYGLLLKEQDSNFTVLFKEDKERKSLLNTLKKPLKLSYIISCTDQTLIQYSDISSDTTNYRYRFVNDTLNYPKLHQGNYIDKTDTVNFVSSLQQVKNLSLQKIEVVKITNSSGLELYNGGWSGFIKAIHIEELLDEGYLNVYFNNQDIAVPAYFIVNVRNAFGVIDIFIDAEGDRSFEASKGAVYEISIDVRSITWRYNLIKRDKNGYTDFKILKGKEEVPITDTIEATMVNGEKAYQLETLTPIPLKERYDAHLELEMKKKDKKLMAENIKQRIILPSPDIKKVKISQRGSVQKAYSEMYIYI